MKYSEPLRNQLDVFFVFLGVGFLLGLCYEILLFLQTVLRTKHAGVLARDLLFCFLSFTVLFCAFLGYSNGVWRLPLLLAGAAGFFVFELSFGQYIRRLLGMVSTVVSRVLQTLMRPFFFAAKRLRLTAQKEKSAWIARMKSAKEKWKRKRVGSKKKKQKKGEKKQKKAAEVTNKT